MCSGAPSNSPLGQVTVFRTADQVTVFNSAEAAADPGHNISHWQEVLVA